MKIVVILDTHGNKSGLENIILKHQDADLFLHLGDGAKEFFQIKSKYPNISMEIVRGNCDFEYDFLPEEKTFSAGAHKILASHGYKYNVKSGLDDYIQAARKKSADIIVYGHTHKKLTKIENDLYIMNPGSLARPRIGGPSYGVINVNNNKIAMNIIDYVE